MDGSQGRPDGQKNVLGGKLEACSHDPVTGVEFWGPEPNESLVEDWDDIDDFDADRSELDDWRRRSPTL